MDNNYIIKFSLLLVKIFTVRDRIMDLAAFLEAIKRQSCLVNHQIDGPDKFVLGTNLCILSGGTSRKDPFPVPSLWYLQQAVLLFSWGSVFYFFLCCCLFFQEMIKKTDIGALVLLSNGMCQAF